MGSSKKTSATRRGPVDRLLDLERLLEATLSGFGVTRALRDGDAEMTLDELGRTRQVDPVRFIGDKRRASAFRREVLFAH